MAEARELDNGSQENSSGSGDPFWVEVRDAGSSKAFVLSGRLGPESTAGLRAEAERLAAADKDVTLDWSGAEHLSAGAFQVLLALGIAIEKRGHKLRVANENAGIRRSMELAGIGEYFPAVDERK